MVSKKNRIVFWIGGLFIEVMEILTIFPFPLKQMILKNISMIMNIWGIELHIQTI